MANSLDSELFRSGENPLWSPCSIPSVVVNTVGTAAASSSESGGQRDGDFDRGRQPAVGFGIPFLVPTEPVEISKLQREHFRREQFGRLFEPLDVAHLTGPHGGRLVQHATKQAPQARFVIRPVDGRVGQVAGLQIVGDGFHFADSVLQGTGSAFVQQRDVLVWAWQTADVDLEFIQCSVKAKFLEHVAILE